MKTATLTMSLVCMLLTGCIERSKVKSDAASEPDVVESQTEVAPVLKEEVVESQTEVASVLKEYEWDEARRLGESYLQSAKDQYDKGYVKQAAETLQKLRKYVDYLTAKDLKDLNALMDKIQTPVAKAPDKAPEKVLAKAPEKVAEQPEQAEAPTEQEETDQDKERLEERDTVVDLLIALNANVESLTCLATEIRDCLQSIEASQQVLINTNSTP